MSSELKTGYAEGRAMPGWRTPMFLETIDLGRTYTGDGVSTPETSLLAGGAALSNVIPKSTRIGDAVQIRLRGTFLNNSGSNRTLRLRVYHGAYALFDKTTGAFASNATARQWGLDLDVFTTVVGAGGTALVRMTGRAWGFGSGGMPFVVAGNWTEIATNIYTEYTGQSIGTDANLATNTARDFNVTAVHSNAANTISTTLYLATVHSVPRHSRIAT